MSAVVSREREREEGASPPLIRRVKVDLVQQPDYRWVCVGRAAFCWFSSSFDTTQLMSDAELSFQIHQGEKKPGCS